MGRLWFGRFAGLVVGAALMAPAVVSATEIILVNGDKLDGEVVAEDEDKITIRTLSGALSIPRARIKEVRQSAPGTTQLRMAQEELKRNALDKALKQCDEAAAAGAPAAAVEEMREKVRKRQAENELARYSALIKRAEESAKSGIADESLEELKELVDKLPPDSPARPEIVNILCSFHLSRADEHKDKVRYSQAITELNRVIELDPKRAEAYTQLGDLYRLSSATFGQALDNFQKALDLEAEKAGRLAESEVVRIHWEMGEIERQNGRWAAAAGHYRFAHKAQPNFNGRLPERVVESFKELATSLVGKPAEALVLVDEALAVRPNPDLVEMRAGLLRTLRKYEESNDALRRLLELTPRRRGANYTMALNYFELGELMTGRETLQREIDAFPNNYEALCLLGDLALQRDDFAVAVGFYKKARDVDSDKPRAALGLGKSFRQRKQLGEARKYVADVLSRLPEDREANLEMGRILRDENKLEEARDYFTKVLGLIDQAKPEDAADLQPLKADALIARGEISLLTAGAATASMDFRRALEVLPEYAQAYYSIGVAYKKKYASTKRIEDLKVSEENLLEARKYSPENAQFALELGILYAQDLAQSDPAKAKDYRRNAVEHWESYIVLGGANADQVRTWISELGT